MRKTCEQDSLEKKRTDADELIKEALKKVPEDRKLEVLRLVEGFSVCAETDKKAG